MVIVETAIIVVFLRGNTNNNDVTLLVTMRSHLVTPPDPTMTISDPVAITVCNEAITLSSVSIVETAIAVG